MDAWDKVSIKASKTTKLHLQYQKHQNDKISKDYLSNLEPEWARGKYIGPVHWRIEFDCVADCVFCGQSIGLNPSKIRAQVRIQGTSEILETQLIKKLSSQPPPPINLTDSYNNKLLSHNAGPVRLSYLYHANNKLVNVLLPVAIHLGTRIWWHWNYWLSLANMTILSPRLDEPNRVLDPSVWSVASNWGMHSDESFFCFKAWLRCSCSAWLDSFNMLWQSAVLGLCKCQRGLKWWWERIHDAGAIDSR